MTIIAFPDYPARVALAERLCVRFVWDHHRPPNVDSQEPRLSPAIFSTRGGEAYHKHQIWLSLIWAVASPSPWNW
jgi:hypothetical protein